MFPVLVYVNADNSVTTVSLSLWSQRKEAQAPLGSAAAAVPQTRAAAAPVVQLQIAVTPTEHFFLYFFYFFKTLYAVKVVSPETFYKKEKRQ